MKKTITSITAFLLTLQMIAQSISGPVSACPDSEQTYFVTPQQFTPNNNQWAVSGGVFTENGSNYISKPANVAVQVTWGSTPLTGSISVFNTQHYYIPPMNVWIGDYLSMVGESSVVAYQQNDFLAYEDDLTNITWSASSGSVQWSNSDKTWVKILFYSTGSKLVTVQGTDPCGDLYTDQMYVNVTSSFTDEEEAKKPGLLFNEYVASDFSAFPNPVHQHSNLLVNIPAIKDNKETTQIRLITPDGKVVKEMVTTEAILEMNTSDVNKGFFILQAISGKSSKSIPIVIQ